MIPTLMDLQNLAAWIVLVLIITALLAGFSVLCTYLLERAVAWHQRPSNVVDFDARRRRQFDLIVRGR